MNRLGIVYDWLHIGRKNLRGSSEKQSTVADRVGSHLVGLCCEVFSFLSTDSGERSFDGDSTLACRATRNRVPEVNKTEKNVVLLMANLLTVFWPVPAFCGWKIIVPVVEE